MMAVSSSCTDRASIEDVSCAEPEAVVRLRPLLATAATTDLRDNAAWTAILGVAHTVTVELVARGELPGNLTVAHDDAPVLATRTIAAAWKHATRSPSRRPRQ